MLQKDLRHTHFNPGINIYWIGKLFILKHKVSYLVWLWVCDVYFSSTELHQVFLTSLLLLNKFRVPGTFSAISDSENYLVKSGYLMMGNLRWQLINKLIKQNGDGIMVLLLVNTNYPHFWDQVVRESLDIAPTMESAGSQWEFHWGGIRSTLWG